LKGREGGGGGAGEEMTQTVYAHVNKWIKKKKIYKEFLQISNNQRIQTTQ
jgi:hypothetical protein